MSAAGARAQFSELLGSVYYTKEAVILQRKGKPYAVVISPEDYERLLQQKRQDWSLIEQVQALNDDKEPDEILADVTREVEAVRQESYAQRKQGKPRRR
jgi:prevent-host-death family protein